VLKGNSSIGLLTTAVNRKDAESAYVGAVNWDLKLSENAYLFKGTIGASRSGTEEERKSGYLAHAQCDKTSGWFRTGVGVSTSSSSFNPNDLGYIERVNRLLPWLWMQFYKEKPWGPFQSLYMEIGSKVAWNLRHEWAGQTERWVNVSKGARFIFVGKLKNFWSFGSYVHYGLEAMDDLDTRGGPLILKPAGNSFEVELEGDTNLSIVPNFLLARSTNVDGSTSWDFGVRLRIKPYSNVELHIGPVYERWFSKAQWVKNVDDDGDGRDDHFVYGELEGQLLDFTTRLNVIFTPNLSLQLYMQPFVAVGDYKNFRELARPSSYDFTPYTKLEENLDFSYRSLRSNLVLRWEYRPGSTLFAVWSQYRSASSDDLSFCPWNSLKESFSDEGENIFLIKLNYWLGI